MKFNLLTLMIFVLFLGTVTIFTVCDNVGQDNGGQGVPTRCEELTGTCSSTGSCPEGYFAWEELGCSSGPCCLPDNECEPIGGYCEYFLNDCKDGYAGLTPMDCPQGRAAQCCIPIE